MRFLSVCSGIEAASVAWSPIGWSAVAFSEIEKFPSAVLAHHYPDVPNLGDFTKINASSLGHIDILCGGTPCQAFSIAGLRQSLADERGNLSLEFVRLAHELATGNGLRNVVWENVCGVLSTKDNAFGCFLAGLVGADDALPPPDGRRWPDAGMVSGPEGRAAWRILDAQFFGLAQRRRRVIVVADFGNGADPAAVLFERKGMSWNPAPSREEGQGVAPTISERTKGGGDKRVAFALGSHAGAADGDQTNRSHATGGPVGSGISEELAYSLRAGRTQAVGYAPEIARCDATREGSSQDYETTTMVAVGVHGDVAHTLKAEGADASEDGTGRGTPIVATSNAAFDLVQITSKTNRSRVEDGLPAPTMSKASNMHVAQTVAIRGRDGGATAELGGEVATALRASSGGGDKPHVLAEAVYSIMPQNSGKDYKARKVDVAQPLMAGGPVGGNQGGDFVLQSAVRRLTPVECERLQGFPDGYTNIPWRGKQESPDGPRYKALGNSWAVPKFLWIGERIARLMPADNDNQERQVGDAA